MDEYRIQDRIKRDAEGRGGGGGGRSVVYKVSLVEVGGRVG